MQKRCSTLEAEKQALLKEKTEASKPYQELQMRHLQVKVSLQSTEEEMAKIKKETTKVLEEKNKLCEENMKLQRDKNKIVKEEEDGKKKHISIDRGGGRLQVKIFFIFVISLEWG